MKSGSYPTTSKPAAGKDVTVPSTHHKATSDRVDRIQAQHESQQK